MDSSSRTHASEDADQAVWRELLSDLRLTLSRLVLLCSTRDPDTGCYRLSDLIPQLR